MPASSSLPIHPHNEPSVTLFGLDAELASSVHHILPFVSPNNKKNDMTITDSSRSSTTFGSKFRKEKGKAQKSVEHCVSRTW